MILLYYQWAIALWQVFVMDVCQLCSINCLVWVEKTVPSMLHQNDFHALDASLFLLSAAWLEMSCRSQCIKVELFFTVSGTWDAPAGAPAAHVTACSALYTFDSGT